jgi:hypothetical protein
MKSFNGVNKIYTEDCINFMQNWNGDKISVIVTSHLIILIKIIQNIKTTKRDRNILTGWEK